MFALFFRTKRTLEVPLALDGRGRGTRDPRDHGAELEARLSDESRRRDQAYQVRATRDQSDP